jgi:leucyl aminopeptidase
MKIQIKKGFPEEIKADALIVWHFQGDQISKSAEKIDRTCNGIIRDVIARGDFEGKENQNLLIYSGGNIPTPRILLVGLGNICQANVEAVRKAYALAVQKLRSINVKNIGTCLDFEGRNFANCRPAFAALEGLLLGDYHFQYYKTTDSERTSIENILISQGGAELDEIMTDMVRAETIAAAVCLARDLGNAPGNGLTPSILAKKAESLAKGRKIKCTVLDTEKIKKVGMSALLGVAQGSHEPPRFIILEYYGGRRGEGNIVLIGKGITFDSGGVSLKPAEKMGEMKADMAGAPAVLAVFGSAADLKLPLNIVGIIPATENMPGGSACKPGDILKSMNGKTIEIISTDAEGRLILADAFTYAERFKPALMIDLATLTGACVVALGDDVAGLFCNDKKLKDQLIRASNLTCEMIWEMPLWDCYNELIKSDVADLKNTGGRNGGAISAAAFLKQFTGTYPWAHIDIAGPGFSPKDRPYAPKGATGFGVRLIVQFLIDCCTTAGR